jgi:hypothetical protein
MDHQPQASDLGQRCIRCPAPENLRCAGFDVRRFCELIDPSCPQYEPGYLKVIVREASRIADNTDARLDSLYQRHARGAIMQPDETILIPADCCGGAVPPGIFDQF